MHFVPHVGRIGSILLEGQRRCLASFPLCGKHVRIEQRDRGRRACSP